MNKLFIKNFKAFKDEVSVGFENKNLLVFGENGSGKSSIYEALKIIFFKEVIERNIPEASTPEEQERKTLDFWAKYNNKNTNRDFHIEINDTAHTDFDTSGYQAFMISADDIYFSEKIKYDTLINNAFFEIKDNVIADFCLEYYQFVELDVNEVLNSFNNGLQIEIDYEDDFTIKIIDSVRGLESKKEVRKYFNEAKLNLIILLLLLSSIQFLSGEQHKKILLLDDFVTSLDVSNRTFLMRYIFDNFSNFQIGLFTHSVNFYNFTLYLINEIYNASNNWIFANAYEFHNENKIYTKNIITSVADIKASYIEGAANVEDVGNKIRQKFEVLLYEYSKLLMIGAVEESNKILSRIELSKNLYYKNGKTASDLVDELERTINNNITYNLKRRLNTKIAEYKQEDFNNIKQILSGLKLYRKITMHPMSHGILGQTPFTVKEIEKSLELLQKFEKHLKNLVDKKIS